jgi:hypothetical protein
MNDNILKKEFDTRTVKRVRDLVTKKYGDATGIQSGYTKEQVDHKEGDIWVENGKEWTIKDGLKQNVTKLDVFKEMVNIPLLCPSCSNPMKSFYDKKMYRIHKMCMNCVTDFEMNIKKQGKWEEYSQSIINNNVSQFLKEYEEFLTDAENNQEIHQFVSEDGIIDKWIGNSKEIIKKQREALNNMKNNNISDK